MSIPTLLERLLSAPGASGHEQDAAGVWASHAQSFAHVSVDALGSPSARVAGTADAPTLALISHLDEIGLLVTHVESTGYLRFRELGGWDAQILVGQRVEVLTRSGPVAGVIGRVPVWLIQERDQRKVEAKDLFIDIGASTAEGARALGIRAGDPAIVLGSPRELASQRLAGRAMDNRLGCFVVLEALSRLAEAGGPPGDVVGAAVVQEETSFAGAATTAYALRPDVAIVVDVCNATDLPGLAGSEHGDYRLGSGPCLGRGPRINPKVFEMLHETAEQLGIPFTVKPFAGATQTDVDAIHASRAGVACGLVMVPLRYLHSPIETAQLGDVESAVDLIVAFAQQLSDDTHFARGPHLEVSTT
jgi:endoglucanase